MVSCTTSPGWRWYLHAMIGFPLVGGLLLLAAAAVAHNSTSIVLLAFGGWWAGLAAGVF
ncbi:MAG: hypothetical protein QOJ73_3715 [Streptosporangiaceae bacterium]|nr:hypothetical protein [Streptosporangiaceae bacterium]